MARSKRTFSLEFREEAVKIENVNLIWDRFVTLIWDH